jgi:hypothetical protein
MESYAQPGEQPKKMSDAEQGRFLTDCRKKLDAAYVFERENRREAAIDLAFLAGYQWPESIRKERQAQGRPILTINRLPQFVRQVTNDIRQADLAIKVSPVDDQSDPKLAKIYNGLLRQIHYQSSAKHVYGAAAEHQVSCGIGWFRICTEFADDETFDQELRLKSIRNPMSVYCDPGAIEPDRSDANWMIVTEIIPTEDFKAKYPGISLDGIDPPTDGTGDRLTWLTRDGVRIAEYWLRKPVKKTIGMTQGGQTLDLSKIGQAMWPMLGITRTRVVDTFEVEQYVISGSAVLSGPHKWVSKWIPLIPVIGSETPLETSVVRAGLIRYARDPQQLYNYNRTAAAETLALQPKAPWLVDAKSIAPFKNIWDSLNRTNYPYVPYDAKEGVPPPTRVAPPAMAPAFVKEAELADGDMKATTGIYDSSLGARSNETSGIAIRNREHQGDTANYHFSDNLERSMWHAGRILIEMIPQIYDTERVVRILGEDDSEEHHRINQTVMGPDGLPRVINDLSTGRFDVRATIGASYATKRMEAADMMINYLKSDPQALPMVRDLLVKNMDWPGADEMAKRFKQAMPPQLLHDPEDPNSPPPPPPPNPLEDPVLRSEIVLRDAQAAKAYADAAKTRNEAAGMVMPEPALPPPENVLMQPQPPPQGMPGPMGPHPEPDMDQAGGPPDFDADNMPPMGASEVGNGNPVGQIA